MSINFELLKPSASMEVTRLAGELKKAGRTVYPLSAGDTHFPPPTAISAKLSKLPAAYSHYTNAEGIDPVRKEIADKYNGYQSKDVILVPGLKQGLFYALAALAKQKLCILEPAWLGYEASAVLAGYESVSVSMQAHGWTDQLGKTSFDAIIVCTPNNPDGKIFSNAEIGQIIDAAKRNDAWIITDFIYDRYVYQSDFTSFYEKIIRYPKLIIGNGYSKSHAVTGFRIGYLLCKEEIFKQRILIMQQNLATCVPAISQYLLINAQEADEEVNKYAAYYKENREVVISVFPEWEQYKPQGGFYYFIDLKIYGISDAQKFCEEILQQYGIALVPGAAYGKEFDSYVRLSFSIDRLQLKSALNILRQLLKK